MPAFDVLGNCLSVRKSTTLQIGVLCATLIGLYVFFTHRISVTRIGITNGASPYCRLVLVNTSASEINVRVAVANPTKEPIEIAEWGLPTWNKLTTDLFEIDRDGNKIEYRGIMMKRRTEPGEMLQIEPGTQASVRISLRSPEYEVNGHGKFTIAYRFVVWQGGTGIFCTSNALVVAK